MHAIIIGGGIGGLSAALALLRAGIDTTVHERAALLGEAGAGLTLSRGAQHCLDRLGVGASVRAHLAPAVDFSFLHFRTARRLGRALPLSDDDVQDGHITRADLHRILADAVLSYGADRIMPGHALRALEQDAGSVTAHFTNGNQAVGQVLIGADGIRSQVRRVLFGEPPPRFTGRVAFRFMLPEPLARPYLDVGGRACLFVGRGQVFNRYLVANDRLLNCVVLRHQADWIEDGWTQPATVAELLDGFAGWHESVVGLLRRAPPENLFKWGIFARPPHDRWVDGRVALLGDAAHPMQPFLGLGAAMAVEDATILGRAFAETTDLQAALAAYQSVRVPRANHVLMLSARQGDLFDTTDPDDFPPSGAPSHDPTLAAFDPDANWAS